MSMPTNIKSNNHLGIAREKSEKLPQLVLHDRFQKHSNTVNNSALATYDNYKVINTKSDVSDTSQG